MTNEEWRCWYEPINARARARDDVRRTARSVERDQQVQQLTEKGWTCEAADQWTAPEGLRARRTAHGCAADRYIRTSLGHAFNTQQQEDRWTFEKLETIRLENERAIERDAPNPSAIEQGHAVHHDIEHWFKEPT